MRSPGAVKSLSGPSLEKSHCVSADVVQVTAIASAYFAGNSTQFAHGPPFPAEAAMSAPFPCAYWTPFRSAEDPDGPPRLRLMTTRGPPLSAHQRIPEATTERGPEPVLDSTLTPWMPTWAMPAIPFALSIEAAAMPLTWVPWPLSSHGSASPLMRSVPPSHRGPVMSSCVYRTPVSRMHTLASASPRMLSHASGARTCSGPYCSP